MPSNLPQVQDRMRASPQRVQDLIHRYNLNNLKKTLNPKNAEALTTNIAAIGKYKKQ